MADTLDLLINGRFLTRPLSGVDRTATELVRALASRVTGPKLRLSVAVPRGAPCDAWIREQLGLPDTVPIHRSILKGYLWEQCTLARLRPEATLLSLCNIGPIMRRSQFLLIHDAQIYDAAGSYSRAFRLAYRLLQPQVARQAGRVATVSAYSRDRLRARGVIGAGTVAIIPNGVDHLDCVRPCPEVLERLGLAAGGYFLALGHPAPHKNLATLLAARRALRKVDLPLVLTGSDDVRALIPPGDLQDGSVRFVGRVDDRELVALYRGARLFLLPSRTEGFGIPLLEAMACGCPVLASTGGALPEVAGEAAILLEPDDPAAWAAMIDTVAGDPARLAGLSAAGIGRARAFCWQDSAQSLVDVLADMGACRSAGTAARAPRAVPSRLPAKP